ncbi:MAG: hypothetical protein AB1898_24330 [Acidobacteriota bacterium]
MILQLQLSCPRCKTRLPPHLLNTERYTACPTCRWAFQLEVFPALFQGAGVDSGGRAVESEGEAGCFYHPQKRAVVPCDACGRFLCSLCEVELDGRKLCPTCIAIGRRKGRLPNLQKEGVLYDRAALMLATLPILFFPFTMLTAPIAFVLAIRHWKTRERVLPRTRLRMILAILLSSAQMGGWVWLGYLIVRGPTGGQ